MIFLYIVLDHPRLFWFVSIYITEFKLLLSIEMKYTLPQVSIKELLSVYKFETCIMTE